MTPVHPQRFNIKGFHHPNGGGKAGTINIEGGYFIQEDIRNFENGFFGINNLEATYMDPQQRKLLEVVYECFESAGKTKEQMSGTNTGVYVGNFTSDFQTMQAKDPDYYHRYHPTGSGLAIMSNRVSHAFNLQGPSMTIDTACSSSIYALHNALTAMSVGDCDQAIVAGANLIQSPEQHIGTAMGGFLSPTSTCHTFDTSADGYGRGEAVNAILVKRLSAAIRDGDKVLAVVRSSAVNANGTTPGITLPDATLQAKVIRRAYEKAGLDTIDTDYIECHGTGTPVGDPIEVEALSRCFQPRSGAPILIGSVKTNLGHSEAASGLTSIIKVVTTLENGKILPTRGVVNINPKLELKARTMKVVTEIEEWPRSVHRASINSFGYGGANGHVILESLKSFLGTQKGGKWQGLLAPAPSNPKLNGLGNKFRQNGAQEVQTEEEDLVVLPIAAESKASLERRVQQTTDLLSKSDSIESVQELARTLGQVSEQLRAKSFLIAACKAPLGKAGLAQVLPESESETGIVMSSGPGLPFAFVFTGQGAQYAGMGRELLLQKDSVFSSTIRDLDEVLRALPAKFAPKSWTLEQALLEPAATSRVNEVVQSQPLCTAIQIGLVRTLRSWGVTPVATVGHSSGEIAAAYTAGLLTASQAILAAYFRGYAVGQMSLGPVKGSMMAAALSPESAAALIADMRLEGQVRVACVNAPESVTLSGHANGIERLQNELQEKGTFNRTLETGGRAYHSHMMAEIGQLYQDILAPYFGQDTKVDLYEKEEQTKTAARVQMFSSVGQDPEHLKPIDLQTDMPSYWRKNLEQPVQFSAALSALTTTGDQKYHLIEIGPHPALKGPIKAIRTSLNVDESALPYSSTIARKKSAILCIKKLAGALFVHGHTLDWAKVNRETNQLGGAKATHLALPPYPWDYSAGLLFNEPRTSIELRDRKYRRHELLGVLSVAGSGVDWTWRNVLRLSEMEWMQDHKLGTQVVFPGAGYMTTAIEAICQASGLRDDPETLTRSTATFSFRNVNISAALVMQIEKPNKPVQELHTHMSRRNLSTAAQSAEWYDFTISSYVDGQTTRHCTGSISVNIAGKGAAQSTAKPIEATVPTIDQTHLDKWAMARWYERSAEEGLCFGPTFQSLTSLCTDSNRVSPDAVSTTHLEPPVARPVTKENGKVVSPITQYPIHPITIDACFQGAIMGGTAGNLRDLRAWLPVFVSECHFQVTGKSESEDLEPVEIHTRTLNTGVSSRSIDCTVRRPGHGGAVAIDMKSVKLSLFTGNSIAESRPEANGVDNQQVFLQRHPTLRVHWKPDVSRLQARAGPQLRAYVADFVQERLRSQADEDEGLTIIGAILDLVGHRKPSMRVLELAGGCGCKAQQLLGLLDKETAFPRCRAWRSGSLDEEKGELVLEEDVGPGGGGEPFDAVVIPQVSDRRADIDSWSSMHWRLASTNTGQLQNQHSSARKLWGYTAQQVISLVAEGGVLVTRETQEAVDTLKAAGFAVLDIGKQTVVAVRQATLASADAKAAVQDRRALIIVAGKSGKASSPASAQLANALAAYLKGKLGMANASIISLDQLRLPESAGEIDIAEKDLCISLLETEGEFLATVSPEYFDRLRLITDVVTDLIWVTGSGMLSNSPDPNLTLSNGLSRALMMEQPALRFAVLDVGSSKGYAGSDMQLQSICEKVEMVLFRKSGDRDAEFIYKNGLLHISRFGPDWDMNNLFRRRLVRGDPDAVKKTQLKHLGYAQLSIGQVGVTDTMFFQQMTPLASKPPSGFVDVELKAVSLNAKDIYSISGRVDTNEGTVALDFSGIVSAVGPKVTHVAPGDRVVVWAPNHFRTTERVPAGCVHKLLPEEDLAIVPALLTVQATVLYALRDRAQLRAGESVLIHAGAGAFGVAAIAYAQSIGATVYTTVGSKAKREFLAKELGVPSSHVFNSRNATFVDDVRAATGGRGVNVIVNSLVGDLLHNSWRCLADFGRFVEIGKRDLVDAGKLDMDVFLRNCTFTAFDLSQLFHAENQYYRNKWNSLMAEVIELYRAGKIKPAPITTFDVADIAQAYRHFHNRDRLGKLVISMQDPKSRVPAAPAMFGAVFDPNKIYLLAGCLGGLGRSLSRWMVARGARNFVFLGRSGCDKPSAQQLVSRLRSSGANVTVVRGDVVKLEDVQSAVKACTETGLPIGGVVQAAMGLYEALFCRMPHKAWHTGIQPKWAGTWNLHNAIEGLDGGLEFFLMTSSISGSVGTATESNYCSANGFLDSFARWRRAQGKPAVSVGLGMISEVGYLHENPDIEALLLRKGIQPLNEDEFLQVIDMALTKEEGEQEASQADNAGTYTASHILTGLEPFSMRKLLAQGFDVSSGTMQDPRNAILSASLQAEQDAKARARGATGHPGGAHLDGAGAKWLSDVPPETAATFASEGDAATLYDAILRLITSRFSNLILMPLDQVDDRKPLPSFGVDSMVAAEFRTWFWSALRVDVPFLDIMSPQTSLVSLSEFVQESFLKASKS